MAVPLQRKTARPKVKQRHEHGSVKFVRSRSEFRRVSAHIGLIFSDVSTLPEHVSHATNASAFVSLGLSFNGIRAGLPFDFALLPGLVHVATRRRLGEEDCTDTCGVLRLPVRPSMHTAAWRDLALQWIGHIERLLLPPPFQQADDRPKTTESAARGEDSSARQLREWSVRVRRTRRHRGLNARRHQGQHAARIAPGSRPIDLTSRGGAHRLVQPAHATGGVHNASRHGGARPHHARAHDASDASVGVGTHFHAGAHNSPRHDQIRFAALLRGDPPKGGMAGSGSAAGAPRSADAGTSSPPPAAAYVGEGNGGDDFTFSFPRQVDDFYRVYAFGFDVLDDTDTSNETLSIYDTSSELIGVLDLSHDSSSTSSFYGFVSSTPVGYASFDENIAADTIGLAGFVFGYREHEQSVYPPYAWMLFGASVVTALLVERLPLRALPRMDLPAATCWLLSWSLLACALGVVVFLARGWRQATLYGVCFLLNGTLSGDNLVVFMMLLNQANLPFAHHVVAVSHGMIAALGVRVLLSLAGAVLLQHCSWLLLLFAAFLLLSGVRMLLTDEKVDLSGASAAGAAGAAGPGDADAFAMRCLGRCVPLYWSDATEARYFARDESGRLCATRMAVCVIGIMLSDVLFAMDSVPVLLSLTTSPFVLVASQTLSLLWLRPIYFLLAALAQYLDSMQQALAVVLVLIGLKIFFEAAGFEVPIAAFMGVLLGWRVLSMAVPILRKYYCTKERAGRGLADGLAGGAEGDGCASQTSPLVKA